ncbi:hypothetical protein [Neobacillus sp. YIM B06451]|uniref:hypothetical protein n=1 Tax=Neobacillus sp. YIM B06451 TaxID=3070994 RepID=UPI00292D67CB|nr:hypothetical protein [Neobacillus sp. YIM B06451]
MTNKLKASVSDADLLINLSKVNRLDILESLFDEIIVPEFILRREVLRIYKDAYPLISRKIDDKSSLFQHKDYEKDYALKLAAEPVVAEYFKWVGRGESECAGYARALEIAIIVSDNTKDFDIMEEEFIMLTHVDILVLLVKKELMSLEEAAQIYDSINEMKTGKYKFSATFQEQIPKRLKRIKDNGWGPYLGLK